MDLRDFVSETLTQIVEGVKSAQNKAEEGRPVTLGARLHDFTPDYEYLIWKIPLPF